MNLQEQIAALLAGDLDIGTLSDDELRALHAGLAEHAASLDSEDADDAALDQLEQVIAVTEQVTEAIAANAASAERSWRAEELRRRREAIPTPPEPRAADPEPDPDPEPADEPETPAEPEQEPARPAPVPIAAAATRRPTMAALAQQTRPAAPARTEPRRITANSALTAAANMPGLGLGATVDWNELAKATGQKLRQLRAATHPEQHVTASITWDYPEDRRLGDGDSTGIINAALSERAILRSVEEQGGLGALVAAGGVCGPLPVFYDMQVDSTADRPLRDSLPSFQATRGGINFNPSPTFSSVGSSATAIWTAANDANPSSPATKPVQTFTCPSAVQEYVYGIPTRVQFSNFQDRYSPEMVAANTQLALANAARVAEVQLLTKMVAGSTKIGATALVSFTRDLMAVLELQANAYRYRHRLREDFPLRAVFPFWVKGAIRNDFLRETAHDRDGDGDQLMMADAYVARLFAARGVIPTYTMDGLGKSTGGTTLGTNAWDWPDQTFAAPTDGAALAAPAADASAGSASAGTYWPSRLAFFLFAEGTWLFLDGGRIDLGVVRDSTLNATNQYQEFIEPIEGLAKRGYESQLIVVPTKQTGQSITTMSAPSTYPY